jgi:hypothetical protein
MPDARELDTHYKTLTDQELLKLGVDGGFTLEAEQVLDKELARRNLTSDKAKRYFAPEWLDKADAGTVGVLALESGERITAEVVGINEEGDRLSVKVVSSDSLTRNGRRTHRAILLHRIISFEPQPRLMEQWPFSDPCRDRTLFASTLHLDDNHLHLLDRGQPASLPTPHKSRPCGLQEASIISYTLFEVFFTFAGTGGGPSGADLPPFKFTCPAVEPQVPRLLWRHLGFLLAPFVL